MQHYTKISMQQIMSQIYASRFFKSLCPNALDVRNVETARGHVGGDQQRHSAGLEVGECFGAVRLSARGRTARGRTARGRTTRGEQREETAREGEGEREGIQGRMRAGGS
jgi:hypothetical protein